MPYIASGNFTECTSALGNGQCVALVRTLTGAPASSIWREGESIVDLLERNAFVAPGTAIATFSMVATPTGITAIMPQFSLDGLATASKSFTNGEAKTLANVCFVSAVSNRKDSCGPSITRSSDE